MPTVSTACGQPVEIDLRGDLTLPILLPIEEAGGRDGKVRYGYVYPFAEGLAGVLMIAGALMWLSIPVALTIGTIGAVSVFKAVYVDRRELKCACVGGDSNVPLGFVSLTENLMMIGMALWMLLKSIGVGIGH